VFASCGCVGATCVAMTHTHTHTHTNTANTTTRHHLLQQSADAAMEEEIAMFKVEGAMVLNSDPIDDYVDDGDRIIAVFKSKASSATAAARECALRAIP
jgi:hypothetical protein